jgi:hypothetical protein
MSDVMQFGSVEQQSSAGKCVVCTGYVAHGQCNERCNVVWKCWTVVECCACVVCTGHVAHGQCNERCNVVGKCWTVV